MAWDYAAFEEEPTDAARLAMLNQHITEVRNSVRPDVTDGEVSVNRGSMVNYLSSLTKRRAELDARTGFAAVGRMHARKGRPGPPDDDCCC